MICGAQCGGTTYRVNFSTVRVERRRKLKAPRRTFETTGSTVATSAVRPARASIMMQRAAHSLGTSAIRKKVVIVCRFGSLMDRTWSLVHARDRFRRRQDERMTRHMRWASLICAMRSAWLLPSAEFGAGAAARPPESTVSVT